MSKDEIKEVRGVRHEISKECGHDIDRLVSFYQKMEEDLRTSGEFRFASELPERRAVSRTRPSPG